MRRLRTSFQFNARPQLTNTLRRQSHCARDLRRRRNTLKHNRSPRLRQKQYLECHAQARGDHPAFHPASVPVITNIYDAAIASQHSRSSACGHRLLQRPGGSLIALTDPVRGTTRFAYDLDGRRTATTNAASKWRSSQWDSRGEAIQSTDPASNSVRPCFDAAVEDSIGPLPIVVVLVLVLGFFYPPNRRRPPRFPLFPRLSAPIHGFHALSTAKMFSVVAEEKLGRLGHRVYGIPPC